MGSGCPHPRASPRAQALPQGSLLSETDAALGTEFAQPSFPTQSPQVCIVSLTNCCS